MFLAVLLLPDICWTFNSFYVLSIHYIYTFYSSLVILQYIFLNQLTTFNGMLKTQHKTINAFAYSGEKNCARKLAFILKTMLVYPAFLLLPYILKHN